MMADFTRSEAVVGCAPSVLELALNPGEWCLCECGESSVRLMRLTPSTATRDGLDVERIDVVCGSLCMHEEYTSAACSAGGRASAPRPRQATLEAPLLGSAEIVDTQVDRASFVMNGCSSSRSAVGRSVASC